MALDIEKCRVPLSHDQCRIVLNRAHAVKSYYKKRGEDEKGDKAYIKAIKKHKHRRDTMQDGLSTKAITTGEDNNDDKKMRSCLVCDATFLSTWKGNRRCPNCENKSTKRE